MIQEELHGGGSTNVFYNEECQNNGKIEANGGEAIAGEGGCAGGAGGNGCASVGTIKNGTYVEKENEW